MRYTGRLGKWLLLTVTFGLLVIPAVHAQDSVYIDHVDGLAYPGAVRAGEPLTFYIKYSVASYPIYWGITGHRIYSPDSAVWSVPTIGPSVSNLRDYWNGGIFYEQLSSDGISPDTVGFAGTAISSTGLPVGYDSLLYQISFEVDESQIGKTICIDSSWFPPHADWIWEYNGEESVIPAWGGPYCYEIVSCCWGQTGDPNLDGTTNIADLGYLIKYLFQGGQLACEGQANVDGDSNGGAVAVSDLSYLVAYLFQGGPPPAACQ